MVFSIAFKHFKCQKYFDCYIVFFKARICNLTFYLENLLLHQNKAVEDHQANYFLTQV